MNIKEIRRANLARLLAEHDFDTDFAEACDLAPAHVSQMKNGTRKMGDEVAQRIEKKKRLPPGYMDQQHPGVGEDRLAYEIKPERARVPVVGTAQLGDDRYWLELEYPVGSGDGFIEYPSRDPNAYAVRCKGDSMRPRIKPGEFVVAEPNRRYMPGDEVVVKAKSGCVMVKVYNFGRNGTIELGSINENHPPITLELNDLEYVHYVVAICKPDMYYRDLAT